MFSRFRKKQNSTESFEKEQANSRLSANSRRVLTEFRTFQSTHKAHDQEEARRKIMDENHAADPKLADSLIQACIGVLLRSSIVSNLRSSLFLNDEFFDDDYLRSVWTVHNAKTWEYIKTRQTVEELAFGYTIDWSVRIADAALARPTYASINYVNHPYGGATPYGSVVANWASCTRWRSTYTHKDTFDEEFGFTGNDAAKISRGRDMICTAEQLVTLIANLSPRQRKALIEYAQGVYVLRNDAPNYIEAQVHGPLQWSQDLEEIWIAQPALLQETARDGSTARVLQRIAQFATRHRVGAFLLNMENGQPRVVQTLVEPL